MTSRRFRGCLAPALFVSCLAAASQDAPDIHDEARAALAAREAARDRLVETYLFLEDVRDRILRRDPLPVLRWIEGGLAGSAEDVRAILGDLPGKGTRLRGPAAGKRRRAESLAREAVATRLSSRPEIPASVADLFARRAAAAWVEGWLEGPGEPDPASTTEDVLDQLLVPARPFATVWNASIHKLLPEVRAWTAAHERFEEVTGRLDRSRRAQDSFDRPPPDMVIIPGGTYVLGPNTFFEAPRREVTIRSFYLDRFEVRNADYLHFLQSLPPHQREALIPRFWTRGEDGEARPPAGEEDRPVTGVSWMQAAAFARWSGKRLPTDEEWECAARGHDGRTYPWGFAFDPQRCVFRGTGTEGPSGVRTHRSGLSPFGAYHMAGNVEEWTATSESGAVAGKDPSNLDLVYVRGGSWRSSPREVSSLARWKYPPRTTREPTLGFRCAKDAPLLSR